MWRYHARVDADQESGVNGVSVAGNGTGLRVGFTSASEVGADTLNTEPQNRHCGINGLDLPIS